VSHSGVSISPDPETAKSYAGAVDYTVTAEDGSTQTYTVTVSVAKSSAANITGFTLAGASGSIGTSSISVTVPYGTSLSSLAPGITVSAGATVSPASGVTRNFTNPVTYTVTAENGTTQKTYTVTVTVASPTDWRLYAIRDIHFYAAGAYWYPISYAVINHGATYVVNFSIPKKAEGTSFYVYFPNSMGRTSSLSYGYYPSSSFPLTVTVYNSSTNESQVFSLEVSYY
ncbi:MAG: DUF5018 domain-containing protein, partial [Treponema sp.]|jgi:hypothetical protein|nr:DUF5018 domain-containing protein [Treponema sp.]